MYASQLWKAELTFNLHCGYLQFELGLWISIIPVLLCGLEACPLNKSDLHSFDFVINKFFVKLFRTSNIETFSCCQEYFGFALPSTLRAKRVQKFELQFNNFMYISSCTFSQCYIAHYRTLHIALGCNFAYSFFKNYYHS